ncbi:hypothetical protein F2Q69_00014363 [Brassica cretica]|uniref:Uncharacterized protein n=1 Tax=Brassica cretica TaxID=69181 RepID=A0A8S9QRM1_BRACR|nr:hypothetical protein F2Q69_00014363 [Brassica cretica]
MEDVSNARVTVSKPPDVELYSRELNATGGAVVSPEIYAAKVWIAAITTHFLCDLHPCPCDNIRDVNQGAEPRAWPVKACCGTGLGLHFVKQVHLVSPSLIIFVPHVMIHWCPLACSRARQGGTSHRSRLMEDVSNARVTVSTPPDVKLYSRELNATEGAVVSPEIYAAKVWITAITTHLLCDLHPCPCDNVSLRK